MVFFTARMLPYILIGALCFYAAYKLVSLMH